MLPVPTHALPIFAPHSTSRRLHQETVSAPPRLAHPRLTSCVLQGAQYLLQLPEVSTFVDAALRRTPLTVAQLSLDQACTVAASLDRLYGANRTHQWRPPVLSGHPAPVDPLYALVRFSPHPQQQRCYNGATAVAPAATTCCERETQGPSENLVAPAKGMRRGDTPRCCARTWADVVRRSVRRAARRCCKVCDRSHPQIATDRSLGSCESLLSCSLCAEASRVGLTRVTHVRPPQQH